MRSKTCSSGRTDRVRGEGRYEYCRCCGRRWNVSTLQKIPFEGYICPECCSRTRDDVRDTLRQRLQRCRVERALSGQTVAELCGLARDAVYDFEHGRRTPRAEELAVLADFYRVSVDWLMGRG